MKIAVFGSAHSRRVVGGGIIDPQGWETFCNLIGILLADSTHTILVESDKPYTADGMVVDGFMQSHKRTAKVWVYHRTHRYPVRPFDSIDSDLKRSLRFVPLPEEHVGPTHFRMLRDADVALVIGGGANSYNAGLAAALTGVRLIPIALFGGAGRALWQEFSPQSQQLGIKMPRRDVWDQLTGYVEGAAEAVAKELSSLPRLMIVHGRSIDDRDRLLRVIERLGVTAPIVLQQKFSVGQTISEKFEEDAIQADGAIALFTPDDHAASLLDASGGQLPGKELQSRTRARQNVCLEYGWFWGRLGRDRVLLLLRGGLELPSDLSGLSYESYLEEPDECAAAVELFVRRLQGGN